MHAAGQAVAMQPGELDPRGGGSRLCHSARWRVLARSRAGQFPSWPAPCRSSPAPALMPSAACTGQLGIAGHSGCASPVVCKARSFPGACKARSFPGGYKTEMTWTLSLPCAGYYAADTLENEYGLKLVLTDTFEGLKRAQHCWHARAVAQAHLVTGNSFI